MDNILSTADIAILVVDGFEQVELTGPRTALEQAGATTRIISARRGQVQGFHHYDKADRFGVDLTFDEADAAEFDAVLLPGGVMNGDAIRMEPGAQAFVRAMDAAHKPIAAICHGGWLLVSAGLVQARHVTSWPTLQDDLRHAGAQWTDEEVVEDGNLVTSRKPDDIPAFSQRLVEMVSRRSLRNIQRSGETPTLGAGS